MEMLATGDVFGFAVDLDTIDYIYASKNGMEGSGDPTSTGSRNWCFK